MLKTLLTPFLNIFTKLRFTKWIWLDLTHFGKVSKKDLSKFTELFETKSGLIGFETCSVIFVSNVIKNDCLTEFHPNKRWPQRDMLCLFGQATSPLITQPTHFAYFFFPSLLCIFLSEILGSKRDQNQHTNIS